MIAANQDTFASCCDFYYSAVHRKIPSSYLWISVQKMVEMSTEAFANTGTSLRTARLCVCEWLSLHTLHLQLPTQNCHFVHKMWAPLSTEGIPVFVDALPRLKNTPLPGERKGNREDHPFKPALYPRNSKKKLQLHFPAVDLRVSTRLCPKRKTTFLYCPCLFTIFFYKLLFWDSSSEHESPECSTFSLQRAPEGHFKCHGTEQFLHCCFSLAWELWSGAVGRCVTQNQSSLAAQYLDFPEPL